MLNTEAFTQFTDQTRKLYTPALRFNGIVANSIQRMIEIQLGAVRSCADLCLTQLKQGSEGIKNIEDLPSPIAIGHSQAELFSALSSQAVDSFKKMGELSNEIKEAMDELVRENLSVFTAVQEKATSQATSQQSATAESSKGRKAA